MPASPRRGTSHRRCRAAGAALCAAMLFGVLPYANAQSAASVDAQRVAPFANTPNGVVTEMLRMARAGPGDFVVDLGSGDGRLVIAAVREFGARGGLGVDINEAFVAYANARAAEAGVADRVRFVTQDLFATDIGEASVVTVYLFPTAMPRLRTKLLAELRPGTRVVSHDFPFPGWAADQVARLDAPEKNDSVGRRDAVIYLYTVPARAPH
jgi:SAM-dependent methyltransferase